MSINYSVLENVLINNVLNYVLFMVYYRMNINYRILDNNLIKTAIKNKLHCNDEAFFN